MARRAGLHAEGLTWLLARLQAARDAEGASVSVRWQGEFEEAGENEEARENGGGGNGGGGMMSAMKHRCDR